jgi:translation initiation factor 6 (eIF-6)
MIAFPACQCAAIGERKLINNGQVGDAFIIHAPFIAGTKCRLAVGNRRGLLLPNGTTNKEKCNIFDFSWKRSSYTRVEERLSKYQRYLRGNDYVALVRY